MSFFGNYDLMDGVRQPTGASVTGARKPASITAKIELAVRGSMFDDRQTANIKLRKVYTAPTDLHRLIFDRRAFVDKRSAWTAGRV